LVSPVPRLGPQLAVDGRSGKFGFEALRIEPLGSTWRLPHRKFQRHANLARIHSCTPTFIQGIYLHHEQLPFPNHSYSTCVSQNLPR